MKQVKKLTKRIKNIFDFCCCGFFRTFLFTMVFLTDHDIACLQKAKNLIDTDLSRHYPIGYLCAYAGMSQTRFMALFKQQFGSSLFLYLRKMRMEQAARLLADHNKHLKAISMLCGYRHYTNFAKVFKRFYQISPAAFRKRMIARGLL